jgi:hypothetical protein
MYTIITRKEPYYTIDPTKLGLECSIIIESKDYCWNIILKNKLFPYFKVVQIDTNDYEDPERMAS